MAAITHGISPDLLIHPGETIAALLEDRGITQKELSKRVGVSEAFLSDVIHGHKDISRGLAKGLEYAFDIPSVFWLNLQANYDAELLELQEHDTISPEEKQAYNKIHEVVDYLKRKGTIDGSNSLEQIIVQLRKFFHVSNLTGLNSLVSAGAFRLSETTTVDPYVLGAWLCLCNAQTNNVELKNIFDPDNIDSIISDIKSIMVSGIGDPQKALVDMFALYGISFSVMHNFRGAPVHGYISRKETGTYQMVVTIRGAYADIFWFSIFHELGHIVNGDITRSGSFIDSKQAKDSKQEAAADRFASDALLDPDSYFGFLHEGSYSYHSIQKFAHAQNVPPYIVIGRLQKDEIIPWNRFSRYKPRYRWAEA